MSRCFNFCRPSFDKASSNITHGIAFCIPCLIISNDEVTSKGWQQCESNNDRWSLPRWETNYLCWYGRNKEPSCAGGTRIISFWSTPFRWWWRNTTSGLLLYNPLDVVKHSLQMRWPGKPTRIILLDVLVVILWRYTSVKDRRGWGNYFRQPGARHWDDGSKNMEVIDLDLGNAYLEQRI